MNCLRFRHAIDCGEQPAERLGRNRMSGQDLLAKALGRPDPIESAGLDELRALQLGRLRQSLSRAARVPHYQKKFAAAGIDLGDVKSLDDLAGLPFTTKEDLRQNYPFGM